MQVFLPAGPLKFRFDSCQTLFALLGSTFYAETLAMMFEVGGSFLALVLRLYVRYRSSLVSARGDTVKLRGHPMLVLTKR